jgi:phosphoribosylglycinamide formyltransferase-1
MSRPRLLILASGTATGGGSGFANLKRHEETVSADIIVASNHLGGGVWRYAQKLRVPFFPFIGPWTAENYQHLVEKTRADFVACSGWLKLVRGLDPATTFNIHPGPLPEFGGKGMYGHHVHEAVMAAYACGKLKHTAICMHFVTEEYDRGPVFFRLNIPILPSDTPDSLGARVNAFEHNWQPTTTGLVVRREIRWSGRVGDPVLCPEHYRSARWVPDE